ncbi:MAG: radical SAM family heme chaperone HemW [Pseudomonadota bacterium]
MVKTTDKAPTQEPENWQRAGFGIYVHWPFCSAKCPYCDFNSHVSSAIDPSAWQNAYTKEIERYGRETVGRVVSSIFFGGGTPSLMTPDLVGSVIDSIGKAWVLANDVEITLEANPTSSEAEKFVGFRSAGVNRISVGVQALNDADLKALGRLHTAEEALNAVGMARDTFDRVSFDLIYGRQDQSLADWKEELNRAIDFGPDHLSLYQLTIEGGTAFGDRFKRGTLRGLPDEDLAADLYDVTQELCETHGLPAYEVSNHAKNGQESRHNLIYWNAGDYVGIGPGAHGRLSLGGHRYATETALGPSKWLDDANSGSGETMRTRLLPVDIAREAILMGLRLRTGIEIPRRWRQFVDDEKAVELEDLGLLLADQDTLRVSDTGRPVLNGILREILSDG